LLPSTSEESISTTWILGVIRRSAKKAAAQSVRGRKERERGRGKIGGMERGRRRGRGKGNIPTTEATPPTQRADFIS
jgi:hypothetical protein